MRNIVSLSIFFFIGIIGSLQALSGQLICLNGGVSNKESNSTVLVNNNDPAILYLGKWVFTTDAPGFYFNDFKASNTQHNRCLFTFRGPFVKWDGSRNNNHILLSLPCQG